MPVNVCQRCGAQLEDSNRLWCETCGILYRRISRLPTGEYRGLKWYQKLEDYGFIAAFGHSNAAEVPRTGWDYLDQHVPRICEMMPGPIRQLVNSRGYSEGVYADLTPRQREIALMWWHEGYTGPQIAETLGITPSAVTGHLKRAAKRLGVPTPRKDLGASHAIVMDPEELDSLTPEQIKAVI